MRILSFFFVALTIFKSGHSGEPIRILAWNIESGGSDTSIILDQLKTQMPEYDLLALSEVPSGDMRRIAEGLSWDYHGSSRGGEDRLMIAWSERFESKNQFELRKVGNNEFPGGSNRSPIFNHLKDRKSGFEFIVVNNHFARRSEENRNLQAKLFVEWGRTLMIPAIAVGDYNLDYDFHTSKGNTAFDLIQADNIWKWVEPKELIDTNWSDPDGDGRDNYPDSMLDFVFLSGPSAQIDVTCEVVVRPNDFPDDEKTSDHRPVLTTIIQQ